MSVEQFQEDMQNITREILNDNARTFKGHLEAALRGTGALSNDAIKAIMEAMKEKLDDGGRPISTNQWFDILPPPQTLGETIVTLLGTYVVIEDNGNLTWEKKKC